ncbi:hypothetical protein [Mesorhizobium sp. M0678]|uniref:hypothetical protein n=1 Tax=Mesorhizobium sp. M0678 TaxID=2956985 RepID=UPI00333B9569
MTVRGRIFLFQIVILALVGLISGLAFATLQLTEEFVRRIDSVHGRFEALAELNGHANNYTEQLAEVLLLGPEQMPDFEAAREAVKTISWRAPLARNSALSDIGAIDTRRRPNSDSSAASTRCLRRSIGPPSDCLASEQRGIQRAS